MASNQVELANITFTLFDAAIKDRPGLMAWYGVAWSTDTGNAIWTTEIRETQVQAKADLYAGLCRKLHKPAGTVFVSRNGDRLNPPAQAVAE